VRTGRAAAGVHGERRGPGRGLEVAAGRARGHGHAADGGGGDDERGEREGLHGVWCACGVVSGAELCGRRVQALYTRHAFPRIPRVVMGAGREVCRRDTLNGEPREMHPIRSVAASLEGAGVKGSAQCGERESHGRVRHNV
jgi:hypothetical protein